MASWMPKAETQYLQSPPPHAWPGIMYMSEAAIPWRHPPREAAKSNNINMQKHSINYDDWLNQLSPLTALFSTVVTEQPICTCDSALHGKYCIPPGSSQPPPGERHVHWHLPILHNLIHKIFVKWWPPVCDLHNELKLSLRLERDCCRLT